MSEVNYCIRDCIPLDHPDLEKRIADMFIALHINHKIVPNDDYFYVFLRSHARPDECSLVCLSQQGFDALQQLEPGVRELPSSFTVPLVDYLIARSRGVLL